MRIKHQIWMGTNKTQRLWNGMSYDDLQTQPLYILVGGFKHFLLSIIYRIILPIDFHTFQDGYCTTKQYYLGVLKPTIPE